MEKKCDKSNLKKEDSRFVSRIGQRWIFFLCDFELFSMAFRALTALSQKLPPPSKSILL